MLKILGNIVDIFNETIFYGELSVVDGKIESIRELVPLPSMGERGGFILPGFIDSHVHIESSMLVPSEFAKLAVVHGTVATISDPHEIANVCGLEGVKFMIKNGKTVPFKFHFGARIYPIQTIVSNQVFGLMDFIHDRVAGIDAGSTTDAFQLV